MKTMRTTLVITTYNWPEALRKVLQSVLGQTTMPDEIIVADDGSAQDTQKVIDEYKAKSPVPLIHVWQEDKGFRRTAILNKAFAKASGDYIIQMDGDAIADRHFVSDHLDVAQEGCFVCGSRVKLTPEVSARILSAEGFRFNIWNLPVGFMANSLRSRLLRHYLAFRYARTIDHLRGCNMAFWRDDLLKVNGYNEDLEQWGHEDGELAFRLHNAGVRKKALKMGGNVFHLYHSEHSKANEQRHLEEIERVKREKITRCSNGLEKYFGI